MVHDVIVVGGSFAGLSAAMQLARARRRVLVIDAGRPRNRFAAAAHGFLGQDGKPPREIQQEALRQLLAYPTVAFVEGEAVSARRTDSGFAVALADGGEAAATCLILAIGMADELPPIPGLQERWGATVLHCPYCHGYEVAGRPLGVLANHALSAHQAGMLPDWGPTTYFTQGEFEPDPAQAAYLAGRGVSIERSPVVELLGAAPDLEAVRLADGRVVPVARACSPRRGCAWPARWRSSSAAPSTTARSAPACASMTSSRRRCRGSSPPATRRPRCTTPPWPRPRA